jgi:PRTRC genetic system protein B
MNVDLHIGQNFRYHLQQALLIYAGNGDTRGRSFVTLHDVQGESKPTLGPAQRLSTAFLTSLAKNLHRNVSVEIMSENVLARTNDMFMWWTPAQMRPMFFGSPDGKMATLNGLSFPQPPLVFLSDEHTLSVRAVKRSQRPTANTKLYVAPYWNVYEDGSICLGLTPIPTSPSISTIPQWKRAFFESEFTHPNGAQRVTTHKGGFAGLWEALASKDQFPTRYLVDAKQTLAAFIEKRHAN